MVRILQDQARLGVDNLGDGAQGTASSRHLARGTLEPAPGLQGEGDEHGNEEWPRRQGGDDAPYHEGEYGQPAPEGGVSSTVTECGATAYTVAMYSAVAEFVWSYYVCP